MPFTFFSHQGPVLPLKLVAPRWVDATALVVGSMTPDLAYATSGTPWYVSAHELDAQLWFCLPTAMIVTVIAKRVLVPVVAAHLPDTRPWHLRDLAALSTWPGARNGARAWLVLATSALLGSLSHVMFDSFTHGTGWVVTRTPALQQVVLTLDIPGARLVFVHDVLQVAFTIVGAIACVVTLKAIARRRLVRATYGPPLLDATPMSRHRLVPGGVAAAVTGIVVTALTLDRGNLTALVMRPFVVSSVFLTVVCLIARSAMTRTSTVKRDEDERARSPLTA